MRRVRELARSQTLNSHCHHNPWPLDRGHSACSAPHLLGVEHRAEAGFPRKSQPSNRLGGPEEKKRQAPDPTKRIGRYSAKKTPVCGKGSILRSKQVSVVRPSRSLIRCDLLHRPVSSYDSSHPKQDHILVVPCKQYFWVLEHTAVLNPSTSHRGDQPPRRF